MRSKFYVLIFALLVSVGGFISIQGSIAQALVKDVDLTTGLPVQGKPHTSLKPAIVTSNGDKEVLWDLTHGVYYGYEPSNYYSNLVSVLQGLGFTVTTTTNIGSETLSQYDVVVICVASAWDEAYTTGEVSQIQSYVQNGGGLLIMGDNLGCPNDNINPVSQTFGITCGMSTLSPDDLYFTDLASHPIFAGVSELYYRAGGELVVTSPGEEVAWTGGGEVTVAVAEQGSGRIVVTGDAGFCDNTYIDDSDNQKFAENIFSWLSMASSWTGGKFDFNDGTKQGWTLQGAYDEDGDGPFSSAFGFHWRDRVNHPNPPGLDPGDDDKGSIAICTIGGHGISNPGATWWIMQFHSPNLEASTTWQNATGYTVEIAECMSTFPSIIIYSNLYVVVYDIDEGRDRYFYNGTAQDLEHDVYGDGNADWNHLTFDWSAIPTFPTNYVVKEVFVNIWGKMSDYVEGGLYLDEVTPIGGLMPLPDIVVNPPSFNVTLAQGATTTRTLTIGNVGSADLTFNISTVPAVGWLSLNQSSGTVTPGTDTDITVTFDASGLSPGTHQTDIVINSNDPDESTVTIPVTLEVTGGGWVGGKFDFNDGTDQGWTLEGAYDESGNGPFSSYFSFDWWDQINHPNTPFTDPLGDNKGSVMLFTPSGHGINNPGATWWIMQFHSPDLSASSTWQAANGYTVEIADAMSTGGTLYSNLYVVVYDIDESRDRYFYNGTAQPLQHYSVADWNHLTFDWSGASGFPTNYIIKEVFVNIWGKMTDGVDGGVFLDEVIPISGPTLQPDITVAPGLFNVTLAQGATTTRTLTIGNVGSANLTFDISSGGSTGDKDVMITGWGDLNPGTSFSDFVAYIQSLGYNVTTSNTFPSDLSGYEILILVGGGSAHEDIPESVVDNFVNSGNGLIIFEGVVWADDFDTSAASNPVQSTSGWDLRTNAHVVDAGNPLSAGVATNCTFEGYSTEATIKSGAQIALRWDDNTIFAATYEYGSGKVVYINDLWSWYANYWRGDVTNGEQLLENALQYVLPGTGPATWLSFDPSSGTVTPGTDTDVTVTFDATGLSPDTYQANIIISSNDPDEPTVTIPVTLEVTGGALPTVKIEPATKEIYLGSTGSVDILIENIADLGSFEFEITYNGTIVQIAGSGDVVLGPFLGSTGRSAIPVGPDIDNTAGSVVYGAASFGTQAGASGSGVLATLTWTPQAEGTTTLNLKNVKVGNTEGTEIPVNEIDGEITVIARFWADIDGDNDVDIIDIQLVAARWNTHVGDPDYDPICDVDNDGDIDIIDIQLVAAWWNKPISSSSSSSTSQLVNPDRQGAGTYEPSSSHAENLILRITPDESVKNGSLMSLAVTVENAVDLGAFQFDLVSNSDQVRVADIQLGEFLGSSGNTVSVVGPARDESGRRIVFGAFSFGRNSGPHGSGLLAKIELDGEVKNSIPIELKNLQLVDKEGRPLRVNAIVNECSEWRSRQIIPQGFALRQNYPNPFLGRSGSPTTSISFELPGDREEKMKVNLCVYNARGQVVRTLVDEEKTPGVYTVHWDGRNELGEKVSSGLYLYTITAGNFKATRKMVILK